MHKPDIILRVFFNISEPQKTRIETNAKRETVGEVLESWIYCQIGMGDDKREPNDMVEYQITIGLDLTDDSFTTESNTGNAALTCGMIMSILLKLDEVKITGLSCAEVV
ncbi:MAG: hypothetical protein HY506_02350 [Candidatus Yanofskybacteria bacterium]|nr:hypothetical protein [Candidatus Yanofskybacteria bacterium]